MTVKINYLNRDFNKLKDDLINFARRYHPDKFLYFNDANPDMLYLEMCAYVGDMLNYYIDKTFNENFRSTAQARESILRIADNLGFFNWGPSSSTLQVSLQIVVPPKMINGNLKPNPDLLVNIESGLIAVSDSGVQFEVLDNVNFADSSNRVIVPNFNNNGELVNYTIKKFVTAVAGQTKIQRFYVSPQLLKPFLQVTVDDTDVLEVTGIINMPGNVFTAPSDSVFDNNDYKYHEVKYLAQNKVFVPLSPDDIQDEELRIRQIENAVKQGHYVSVNKRFIVRRDINGLLTITFGNSRTNTSSYKQLIDRNAIDSLEQVSMTSLLDDKTLGETPNPDSTLFIRYRVSNGGIDSNIAPGQLNTIVSKKFIAPTGNPDLRELQNVRKSLQISNILPAVGGREELSNEEIKHQSGVTFAAQDRAVTYEDFKAIINDMPVQFGSPFRISYEEIKPKISTFSNVRRGIEYLLKGPNGLILQDSQVEREKKIQQILNFLDDVENGEAVIPTLSNEPISFSTLSTKTLNSAPSLWIGEKARIYVIGIDENEKLVTVYKDQYGKFISPTTELKQNIKKYLIEKRLIGDWVDILDGRVVNFQIEFTVMADPSKKRQVLTECLNTLRSYFEINKWQMNQPIFVDNVRTILQEIRGVINVVDMKFYNVFGTQSDTGREYQIEEVGRYRNNKPQALNITNNKFEMKKISNTILSYPDTIFELRHPDVDIVAKSL